MPISSLRRQLTTGTFWALGGRGASLALTLLVNALLARLLSPADFGAYLLVVSLVTALVGLADVGTRRAVVRVVADGIATDEPGRSRAAISWTMVLTTAGAAAVAALLASPLGRRALATIFESPSLTASVGLLGGLVATRAFQGVIAESFRGLHRIDLATLFDDRLLSLGLVAAVLVFVPAVGEQAGLRSVVVLLIAAGIPPVALGSWLLQRRWRALSGSGSTTAREMLDIGAPLVANQLTMYSLTQVDLWVLAALAAEQQVAVYGAAARVAIFVSMPLVLVNRVLPPLIAGMYATGDHARLERSLRVAAAFATLAAAAVAAVFALWGDVLLGLVFGELYASGAVFLTILSLGRLAAVALGSPGFTLMMSGHHRLLTLITIAIGSGTALLTYLVVPVHGSVGVAAVTAGGLVVQNLVAWVAARRRTGLATHLSMTQALSALRQWRAESGPRRRG